MRVFKLLLLSLLLLVGCRATNPYDPVPKHLYLTLQTYQDVVRWKDLNKIYQFGGPEAEWEVQTGLENVRVTHYEASTPNEIEPWLWGQLVVIDYVLTDRQVVRRLVDKQLWTSDDEGKSWHRVNPPPRF